MIKKGTSRFCSSPFKVLKLLFFHMENNKLTKKQPSEIKCCEVCANEDFLCHVLCKYRQATYQEFLDERFKGGSLK